MLIQSKSNLARLMATENILIEQKKVPTAYFDLKNRVLTIPTLDGNLSSELLDLLLGHEVGHALETPEGGWHHSVVDLKVNRSILNVCEDARIEKKIKRKFPGIRSSFLKGYRELIEKDFFGIKNMNINDLNFIDRVNLYTKGGSTQGIEFLTEEESLLREVENTETFDEVVLIAQKIEKFMKEQKNKEDQDIDMISGISAILNGDADDNDYGDDADQEMLDDDSLEGISSPLNKKSKNVKKEERNEKVKSTGKENYIDSKTDNIFREKENELLSKENKSPFYMNVPELDLKEIIVSYTTLLDEIEKQNDVAYIFPELQKEFNSFRKESNKVVSYLVKEFELKKNASQLSRTKVSKTGDINMNKIHEYKFTDDIFARITKVPNGKSHGLVLFIDWSGSMLDHINSTIRQLLNIIFFCKKLNIPFEVYAFSTHFMNNGEDDITVMKNEKPGDIFVGRFSLLNLLSSKMPSRDFMKMCTYLVNYLITRPKRDHHYFSYNIPHIMNLSGTPLNECIVAAFEIVPKFKEMSKVEIVNTVFLSDGDGSRFSTCVSKQDEEKQEVNKKNRRILFSNIPFYTRMYIRDTKTKSVVCVNPDTSVYKDQSCLQTSALLKLLKERAGGNIIGFYIALSRDLRRFFSGYSFAKEMTTAERDKHFSEFSRKNFTFAKVDGYDEYYFLRSDKIDLGDDADFEPAKTTTRSLVSAFSKYRAGRVNTRIILNRFIHLIS